MGRQTSKLNGAPASAAAPVMARGRWPAWLVAGLLVLGTLATYWPATRYAFVVFDDPAYVTANPQVQGGLSWEGVKWAFLNPVCCNWHPLTVLSHMLVCQAFGLQPWAHHLASLLLHALNAGLVFALLRQMTGATWRSLMVAALFAVHPLHVESVAWVAERKDVLSGFFGLLALMAYARYARRTFLHLPSPTFYVLALVFLALGLMSKPMLVTWPFVMLLLDYWPLGRFAPSPGNSTLKTAAALLIEKLPFFALAAAASVVTFLVQQRGDALMAAASVPLAMRIENGLISYGRYLGKMFWPKDLAAFYPYPQQWSLWGALLAGALILCLSALFWQARRRYPFLLTGWLWFLGTLIPVIGLVQVGGQAMADRYTYLPSLGVLILAVWGACELSRHWRYRVPALSVAGGGAILVCLALTRHQMGYWQGTETLFRHALAVTENNYLAHNNLGYALTQKGQMDEAIRQFREAIRLHPLYAGAHNNLGYAFANQGQIDEAIPQYEEAIRLDPGFADAHNNLAVALNQKGQIDEALRQFREAIRLNPEYADAHNNLGAALVRNGQVEAAITQFREALRLQPDDADSHYNLALVLGRTGQIDEAIGQLREVIRLKPGYAIAHHNLGNALEMKGQNDEAVRQYQEATRLDPDDADAHNDLGLALARRGQLDEAIRQFREAVRLKPDNVVACNNLGVALRQKGQLEEAISEFREAIRLHPEYADAHNNLANALAKKGQMDEAIRQFQEAIRLQPARAETHNNLGLAFARKGQWDEAIRQFQQAVKLKPDYADARRNLDAALAAQANPSPPPAASTNR